jgi:transcriptional regulator with XRE-family HTH domain
MPKTDIFNRLLFLREKIFETSQAKIATFIGTSQRNYGRYETGESEPPYTLLLKISEILGVSVEWLFNGKIDPNLCAKIKSTRLRYGKPSQFAEKIGVPVEVIQAVEACKIQPSEALINKICAAYGLNKYEIVEGLFPPLAASKSTGSSREDYEITRRHLFEKKLSAAGELDEWNEMLSIVEKYPALVKPLLQTARGHQAIIESAPKK